MRKGHLIVTGVFVGALLVSGVAMAWSAAKIDREVTKTIAVFKEDVKGAEIFLTQAAGYLVFPRVYRLRS